MDKILLQLGKHSVSNINLLASLLHQSCLNCFAFSEEGRCHKFSDGFTVVLFSETIVRPVRDLSQSSIYDPFAGMKTPGQRQLITLQEQVKMGILNVDEAVLHFKEWQLNQKKRSESFRFQQVRTYSTVQESLHSLRMYLKQFSVGTLLFWLEQEDSQHSPPANRVLS